MPNSEQPLSPEKKKAMGIDNEQESGAEAKEAALFELLFDDRGQPFKLFLSGKEVPFKKVHIDDKRGAELLGDPNPFGNPTWEEIDDSKTKT